MIYKALHIASGLSLREAAEFHGVSRSSIENWVQIRRGVPPGVIEEIAALVAAQERSARESALIAEENDGGGAIEIGYPCDDAEAIALGWPCRSAWQAMAGRFFSMLDPEKRNRVIFVPRGSTLATSAAADAHGL